MRTKLNEVTEMERNKSKLTKKEGKDLEEVNLKVQVICQRH